MVILAFGHTYIQSGVLKKGAIQDKKFFESDEQSLDGKWITSSFCQIEGAMAISNNIPILIIKQKNLRIDGILKVIKKLYLYQIFHWMIRHKLTLSSNKF